MKRIIHSITVFCLLSSFGIATTFAQLNERYSNFFVNQDELLNPDNEESDTTQTNYVAELNKIGIAGRPESDNAAPYYQKAIEFYVKPPSTPSGLIVSTRIWPKELPAQEQALLREWVQDNNRTLEQLQLGSQKPYCWFKHTGEKLQTDMSRLKAVRQLLRALQARAKLQAEDGDISGATNDIVTLYKFGAHFTDGPKSLIEKLVGMPLKSLSIRTAFDILDKKMVDADMMKNLEDRFKQLVTDYSEPFDIRGEKIYLQEQIETDPKYRGLKPYLKSTLEYYDTIATKNPWQLHNEKTQSITEDNPLIETAGSGIPLVIEIEYRIRADEQALIITLAVLRYNADSGGYPATLPHLVSAGYLKELPIDPFSNKPLVYKQTRQGFKLYSFGADFDDDGGLHSKWGSGEQGGDQVFWPVESTGGAEVRAAVQKRLSGQELAEANRLLHEAVVKGDISQVKLLISEGADVNTKDQKGRTPLAVAKAQGHNQIVELLLKHGAKEPSLEDMMRDRYYEDDEAYADYGEQSIQRQSSTPVQVDILADPNEIKARVKTFDGLEKALEEVAGKSQSEMRQWQQKRYDNRTLLIKTVQKQFEEEIGFVQKAAVEEKAKKTTEAIDSMLSRRQELFKKVGKELMALKRELVLRRQPARGRGRARTPVRSTRGRYPQRGQAYGGNVTTESPYDDMSGMNRYEGASGASEQIDEEAENEMRQWLQGTAENRADLAKTVHEQIRLDISYIRNAAVEEAAKKTTATIDGLLLARQIRFEELINKMEEEKRALEQTQDPRIRGRGGYIQQQNQPRTRRRR